MRNRAIIRMYAWRCTVPGCVVSSSGSWTSRYDALRSFRAHLRQFHPNDLRFGADPLDDDVRRVIAEKPIVGEPEPWP
jgi:hypothetical protein